MFTVMRAGLGEMCLSFGVLGFWFLGSGVVPGQAPTFEDWFRHLVFRNCLSSDTAYSAEALV